MSGMFDTKTDKTKRKQELSLKEDKARKKKKIITVSVTVVVLLAMLAAILINSNFLRRTLPVLTVDGISFTTAEYEYFFNQEYLGIANELNSQGMDSFLPDPDRPLSGQVYDSVTGETWADFINQRVFSALQEMAAINNMAKAAGFKLSEERYEEFESMLEMHEYEAAMYGFPSLDNYLQRMYGSAMNRRVYLDMLEFVTITEDYSVYIRDSFTYTPEQIEQSYAESADELDVFNYRSFVVEMGALDTDGDGQSDLSHEEAMTEAGDIAEAYIDAIESEEDFLTAAADYDALLYGDPAATLKEYQGYILDNPEYMDFYFAEWLRDEARQAGDVTTIDVQDGIAIVYFISRDNNDYRTLSMRQLLFSREAISVEDYGGDENDPAYLTALEAADNAARERAEAAESLFIAAGATENALIDLVQEHSDDSAEGGLYEDITKLTYQGTNFYAMKVVPEIEEWLFEEGRAIGDSELIETEAYGYHLIYFAGYGDIFAQMIAEDKLRIEDTVEWLENLTLAEPVRHGWFILVNT